jgi:hypothetical protein
MHDHLPAPPQPADANNRPLAALREQAGSITILIRARRLAAAAVLLDALTRDIAALPWLPACLDGRWARDLERFRALAASPNWEEIPGLLRRHIARLERHYRRTQAISLRQRLHERPREALRLALFYACAVFVVAVAWYLKPANLTVRVRDFASLQSALEHYRRDHGGYPVSFGFDGAYSRYGASRPDWIASLVPGYLPRLPRDPRTSYDDDKQYLYMSDGADYMLLAANPEDYDKAAKRRPELLFPQAGRSFYGVATTGAAGWNLLDFNPETVNAEHTAARLRDLDAIKNALERYKSDHRAYPKSEGFDGFRTSHGRSGEFWIEGLVPDYLSGLPRDPRQSDDPNNQYYYKSDGTDYKLIDHNAEDCLIVRRARPELIDPARICFAYGYWTGAARNW